MTVVGVEVALILACACHTVTGVTQVARTSERAVVVRAFTVGVTVIRVKDALVVVGALNAAARVTNVARAGK